MTQQWHPHAYQVEAMRYVVSTSNCGLWFSPGCGKTSCVLGSFCVLKAKGYVTRMLVVAPPRVAAMVWPAEKNKWADFAHLRMVVLQGTPAKRDAMLSIDADIYVCTLEGFKDLIARNLLPAIHAEMIVFDESSNYRNHMSARFKLAKPILIVQAPHHAHRHPRSERLPEPVGAVLSHGSGRRAGAVHHQVPRDVLQ